MLATLVFVPPGGGEADYSLEFDFPALPRPGDYIQISRPMDDELGSEDFIVRRVWWSLRYFEPFGEVTHITVEAQYAKGPYSKEHHKKVVDGYKKHKGIESEFEETAY